MSSIRDEQKDLLEDEDQYTEEEVEEEVEEEIEEDVGETPGDQGSLVQVSGEDARSVSAKSTSSQPKPRGKVSPSRAVANMEMRTPSDKPPTVKKPVNKRTTDSLSPSKNPFPTFGMWDAKTISQIQIRFPDLTNKCETTNELTMRTKPEARFWKNIITFSYESFSSETIRFNNVQIPCMPGTRNYGTDFVYISLPIDVGTAFIKAGKLKRPTMINENRLVPDGKRWWKSVNGVNEAIGSIDAVTKKFVPKPLDAIFEATSKGVTVNLILKFFCKARTDNKEPIKGTTVSTVAVEVVRGYLVATDVDVEGPIKIARQKRKIEPLAVSTDVATDDLSRRLAELGI